MQLQSILCDKSSRQSAILSSQGSCGWTAATTGTSTFYLSRVFHNHRPMGEDEGGLTELE